MNVVIVDGLNLIRRVHAAVGSKSGQFDLEGVRRSCAGSLRKVLHRQHPSHVMCIMDSRESSWRHREFPEYKANRKPMQDDLRQALPEILAAFSDLGVDSLSCDGFEADDVIATIATRAADGRARVTIVSTDKGFCQIINPLTRVYDHFSDRYLDRQFIRTKFEVEPPQLSTLFALAGDAGQNVPGVHSIGVHTAAKLIHDYDTLEKILDAARDMPGHIGEKLRTGEGDARLAQRLLSLRTDVDVGLNLKDFRYTGGVVGRPEQGS